MSRTALLDGDTLVYAAARTVEKVTHWGDDLWTLWAEADEGRAALDTLVERIATGMNADRVVVALSDYDHPNWRLSVMPTYKQHRAKGPGGVTRPLLWQALREHFGSKYESFIRPTLEGDDILGILATHPTRVPGEKVIVSLDKDMRTIPGYHCNFTKSITAFGWEVYEVSPEEADRFHLWQTLVGDTVDGYPGCPGCGPKTADKVLDAPSEGTMWEKVVKQYEKAGYTADDALRNARVARICRASDYSFVNKEVKLWNP